jgi:hypothetical protein
MQSAQSVSAAYYFNLAARDYSLGAGAIELVVEGVPCSAFIQPSQSCELIFCARLDRLRGRNHAGDGGKFRRDWQEQNGHATRQGCFNTRYLMVGDYLRCRFAEGNLIAHFLYSRSEGFDLFLLLRNLGLKFLL